MFFETFSCGSERNYTQYCNPELEKLFHKQSQTTDFEKRRALVWEIDRKLQEDGARPVIAHGRGGISVAAFDAAGARAGNAATGAGGTCGAGADR